MDEHDWTELIDPLSLTTPADIFRAAGTAAARRLVIARRASLDAWKPEGLPLDLVADLVLDDATGLELSRFGQDGPPEAAKARGDLRASKRKDGTTRWTRKDTGPLAEYRRMDLISPDERDAGVRFYRDWYLGGLMQRITPSYSGGRSSGGADPGIPLNERQIDARARVRAATDALGPKMAAIVIRVCCYEQPANQVATALLNKTGRAARSAGTTALSLALARLDEHYQALEKERR